MAYDIKSAVGLHASYYTHAHWQAAVPAVMCKQRLHRCHRFKKVSRDRACKRVPDLYSHHEIAEHGGTTRPTLRYDRQWHQEETAAWVSLTYKQHRRHWCGLPTDIHGGVSQQVTAAQHTGPCPSCIPTPKCDHCMTLLVSSCLDLICSLIYLRLADEINHWLTPLKRATLNP